MVLGRKEIFNRIVKTLINSIKIKTNKSQFHELLKSYLKESSDYIGLNKSEEDWISYLTRGNGSYDALHQISLIEELDSFKENSKKWKLLQESLVKEIEDINEKISQLEEQKRDLVKEKTKEILEVRTDLTMAICQDLIGSTDLSLKKLERNKEEQKRLINKINFKKNCQE